MSIHPDTIPSSAQEADPKHSAPLDETTRALFLAAQHCQGGHSAAGFSIARLLGVPFPLRMDDLISNLRHRGQNPATYYPWLIKAALYAAGKRRGQHPYFTEDEMASALLAGEARAPADGPLEAATGSSGTSSND